MDKQMSFGGDRKRGKDSPGKKGDSQIHLAARAGNVSKIKDMFSKFTSDAIRDMLSKQNQEGETPLYISAENGYADIVREFLKHLDVASASIAANNGYDPFHVAARQGHFEVLKELLQFFPNLVMTTDSSNSTALHTAATQGHIDIVNLLLDTDSNLAKIARNNGKTVLHTAARMGYLEVVKSLLKKDPTIGFRTDKKGQTALHMAVKGQNVEIVLELIKPDSSILGLEDSKGNTALHIATRKGRTQSITFNWVNDVVISGLTSMNSQLMHIVINSCKNVNIIAPDLSPNTDGIHVQGSTGVTISVINLKIGDDGIHVQGSTGVTISVINLKIGDDCISIGPGTRNLWMEKILCGPGHGISIGSLARDFKEEGVQNVTLINSVFTGSDNRLRIKSWARPSTGFVRNINYKNIVMNNVQNPIIIDQNYCPNNQGWPGQNSGTKISQVVYQNIQGTSATPRAMIFDCSASNPCKGIKLHDIKLTYLNKRAKSLCKNIGGLTTAVIMPENCL